MKVIHLKLMLLALGTSQAPHNRERYKLKLGIFVRKSIGVEKLTAAEAAA